MSSTGGKRNRNRRNRRSQGGAKEAFGGAGLHEAFANPAGGAKDGFADAPKPPMPPAPQPPAQKGGRRKGGKTRKLSKGARAWTQAVTKIYRQMKAKDKTVKLRDAMKRASALKKRGQL
jgi:hypothetical protein